MVSVVLLVAACGLTLAVVAFYSNRPKPEPPKGTRWPPFKKGLPYLGSLVQLPSEHSWLTFKEWADQLGPLFGLDIMGRYMVVVSTEKIANDLLRERGALYSSREQLPFAAKLMSKDLRPLLLPYGDLWRRGRKLMHVLLMPSAATSYQPLQEFESERLLYEMIRDPARYESHFENYAGAVIMRLAFGKSIDEPGTESFVRRVLHVVHTVERVASPGAYLVDTFPVLLHLPSWLAPFKREAQALHESELALFRQLQADVQQDMQTPHPRESFTRTFLERQDEFGLSLDEAAYVIGTLFEAGAGTTAAAMMSFCLAMCHSPEWQRKLQEEVDSVTTNDRMPTFDDLPRLPTVRAIAKEVLRWRPVTAGGVPHQLIKNDVYDGFFLPAGTIVHANQWAIHNDPTLYPSPSSFNPSRWLSSSYPTYHSPLSVYPDLLNYSAFGFGRRICPGLHVAERSLYILIARLGWACTISPKPGKKVPWYEYTAGFNVQPKPFEFDLTVRNKRRGKLVEGGWMEKSGRDGLDRG